MNSRAYSRLACSGVGGGKSAVGAIDAWVMHLVNGPPNVPEDDARAMIVAPTYDMLKLNTLQPVKKWWPLETVEDPGKIDRALNSRGIGSFDLRMKNGFVWHFRSGDDPDHLRGPNLVGAWLDEPGQMSRAVWDVIQGRIRVKCPRPFINLTTTPAGFNWLYDEFGPENENPHHELINWDARQNATNQVDGFYDKLAATYSGQMFEQEVKGLFVDINAFAYLDAQHVTACESTGVPAWDPTAETYAGVDIGHKADLTVIWVWQHKDGGLVTAKIRTLDKTQPMPVHEAAVREVCKTPNMVKICIDETGKGAGIAAAMEYEFPGMAEGVPFTAPRKELMASRMKRAFEMRRLVIPKSRLVRNDLMSVERSFTDAGNPQLVAPRQDGSHADRFWAAALGIHAAGDWILAEDAYFGFTTLGDEPEAQGEYDEIEDTSIWGDATVREW